MPEGTPVYAEEEELYIVTKMTVAKEVFYPNTIERQTTLSSNIVMEVLDVTGIYKKMVY